MSLSIYIYMGTMPGKYSFLDESDVVLIESIKCTPALYNPKHRDYYSVCKKREYWSNIAETLRIPQWEVCRRWNCLRKRYVRDLRQLLHNPHRADICNTEFYKRMDFLKTFIRNRSDYCKSYVREYTDSNCKNDTLDIIGKLKPFIHFGNTTPVAATATTTTATTTTTTTTTTTSSTTTFVDFNQHVKPCEAPVDLLNKQRICNNNNDSYACKPDEQNSIYEKDISTAQNFYIDFMESIKKMEDGLLFNDTTISNLESRNNQENNTNDINMRNSLSTPNLLNSSIMTTNTTTNQLQCVEEITLGIGQNATASNTAKVYVAVPQMNESDECFSKTIASYLQKLPIRYKIKAEIEIMQILKAYIEMEDIEQK